MNFQVSNQFSTPKRLMFFIHSLSVRSKKGLVIHLDTDFNDYFLSNLNNFIMDYCANKTHDYEGRKVK